MNFKVRENDGGETLTFYLEEDEGGITLKAEEADSNTWSVLKIQEDGKLILYEGIPDSIGLDVDSDGGLNLEG